jgi:flagellar hook protein FlgE
MSTSLTIAQSALSTFSQGLNAISNNVSNLSTNGFKGSKLEFSAFFAQQNDSGGTRTGHSQGSGVSAVTNVVNFKTGDFAETGSDLDLGIDGVGFFILQDEAGNLTYTKNGHFAFKDDILMSSDGKRVMALDASNNLQEINISDLQSNAGKATTKISLIGASLGTSALPTPLTPITSSAFKVFDAIGGEHSLKVSIIKVADATNEWRLSIKEGDTEIHGPIVVKFNGSGVVVEPDNRKIAFTYRPVGYEPIPIELGLDGLTVSSNSYLDGKLPTKADGYSPGRLTTQGFSENGQLSLSYSNLQTDKRFRIALASFDSTRELNQIGNGAFRYDGANPVRIGTVHPDFGSLKVGFLEKSNVNLTLEFTEMIAMQRGYQAASKIVSTANEMMQTIIETGGR